MSRSTVRARVRNSRKAAASSGKMAPPQGGAVVRMYCTGLGDCFLLGFPSEDGKTAYILIDCGVWKGTRGATVWMQQIFQHIREEVGERGLDLLVATHSHWDHLSGFAQARDIFEDPGFRVKRVWLPWTENPEDQVALRMAEERRLALRAALAAVGQLRLSFVGADQDAETPSNLRSTVENVEALLKFSGYSPPEDEDAAAEDRALEKLGLAASPDLLLGAGPSTDDLLEIVRGKVDVPEYIRPNLRPQYLAEIPGVQIYALGPPTDPEYLGRDDPSTAPGKSEVYLAGMPMNEDAALYAAAYAPADGPSVADEERRELTYPFDRWQRYTRAQALADSEHGGFFKARYEEAPDWRRIDSDWLEVASQLALNLDDHVNNTSLVLAFELGTGGPVLLFPGDAQVGNWLSWHELKGADGLTVERLLNRTVLYKVGHHASHNATLKEKGLKMMTNTSRLVAMIPVDEAEAHKPKGRNKDGWAMPYDKLLADLKLRTEGRVLRADRGVSEPQGGEVPDWSEAKKRRWKDFKDAVSIHEVDVPDTGEKRRLYIQYTVHG